MVIGHRGTAACAPENTREGIALALARGADAVEFDVRLSADGEVVLMHDPTVDRTTDGTGPVSQKTMAELRELDASAQFVPASPNAEPIGSAHRVPALSAILEEFAGARMLIEIKDPLAATLTRRLIEKHGAQDLCLIDSYSSLALRVFRGSGIPAGAGRNGVIRALARRSLGLGNTADGSSAFCVPLRYHGVPLPLPLVLAAARETGKVVHIWTVNDPSVASELWRQGVTGIITDDVVPMLLERART